MKTFTKYIQMLKKITEHHKCKPSSAKVYLNSYNWIQSRVASMTFENIKKVVSDCPIESRRSRLNGAIKVLSIEGNNELIQQLKVIQVQIDKEYNDFNIYRTIDNVDKIPTWQSICSKYEELKEVVKKSESEKVVHLYLSILMEIPPLRNEDYVNTLVVPNQTQDNGTNNVIILDTGSWLLRSGKTSGKTGTREINLSESLVLYIRTYMNNTTGWLFPMQTDKDKCMTISNFGMMLKRNLKVSCSMIRNIYVSDRMDKGINGEARKALAKQMGHSPQTQAVIYSKLSNNVRGVSDDLNIVLENAIKANGKEKIIAILKALA